LPAGIETLEQLQGLMQTHFGFGILTRQPVCYPPGPMSDGLVQAMVIARSKLFSEWRILSQGRQVTLLYGNVGQHRTQITVGDRGDNCGPYFELGKRLFQMLPDQGELALRRERLA
jgi:hypothetical protein